jgi:hypothetical protein
MARLMDRPRVIIHNLISLDGRLDGFPADAGLYYEMASRLPHHVGEPVARPGRGAVRGGR